MSFFDRVRGLAVHGALALAATFMLGAFASGALAAAKPQPANPHGAYKAECAMCHTASDWRSVHPGKKFDHSRCGFPLEAAHAAATCTSCHGSLDFTQSTHMLCASCHTDPHRGEMGSECARCHGSRSFTDRGPMLRAHSQTSFPLTGSHILVECSNCHRPAAQGQMQFAGTHSECRACHEAQYKATRNPDHTAQGFPTDCRGCHATTAWSSATFDHSQTSFALTGAHQAAACASCHTGGKLTTLPTDCYSCHSAQYSGAAINHTAAGFATGQCATCHSTSSFAGGRFDHGTTSYALVGAHASATCQGCHAGGVFNNRSTDCAGCHQADYDAAVPSHSASGFAASQCATCHSTVRFAGAVFNHGATRFALTGAHVSTTCQSCHADGVYHGKAMDCASCHQSDYSGATVNHTAAGFAAAQCATCHSTSTFRGGLFNHATTSFALTGSHTSTACIDCHRNGVYNNHATDCASCHMGDYNAAIPNHATSGFPAATCATCHSTTTFAGAVFNHTATSFPLTGAHLATSCQGCHSDGVYDGKPTACASCHQSDYAAASINHTAAGFAASQCASCHTTSSFIGGTFNHAATSFALTGSHVTATCRSCHTGTVFNNLPADCASCHMTDYNGAAPNHAASGFSASACATCHGTTTFAGATFNHSTSSFPLTGAHLATSCQSCHSDGVYDGKPTACASCHQSDYTGAPINHTAAGFAASACATCHTTASWARGTFNHSTTSFALTGSHVTATCQSCHTGSVFNNLPAACSSCHLSDYNGATPNHAASGFSAAACATCHSTTTFAGAVFNHTTTSFPLTGAHLATSCQSCHSDGVYDGKPTACASCHMSDYTGAPINHTAAGFTTAACATCHTTTTWTRGTFNHATTSFALTGSHVTATCQSCHTGSVFNNLPADCASCHMSDYNGAVPNHAASGFSAASCTTCHNTTTFTGAVFNHSTTSFPLTGAHVSTTCASCHSDGVYDGKPTACASCHMSDYTGAPLNHTAAGFTTAACATCHTTTTWTRGTFNHSTTSFPLTGSHVTATCRSCHTGTVFNNLASDCYSCHQQDYLSANPSHAASGFAPSACAGCHTTTTFTGAVFNHATTSFPLTGAHVSTTCNSCHADGVYDGKPTTCISCHQSDWTTPNDPNHIAAGFNSAQCTTCHTTTAWANARMATHDASYFKIYSGKHNGRWSGNCSTCHTNSNNYAVFNCLSCHSQSEMNNQHAGRSGYSYTNTACYSCHSRV